MDQTQGFLWSRRALNNAIRPTICSPSITSYCEGFLVRRSSRSVTLAPCPILLYPSDGQPAHSELLNLSQSGERR